MEGDFINKIVEYLAEEGQTYCLDYGFKLGDTIRFTPSEVGKILKKYFDQEKERGNMIGRTDAIRLISGYKGVVDKSVAKRLLMQMEGIGSKENIKDSIYTDCQAKDIDDSDGTEHGGDHCEDCKHYSKRQDEEPCRNCTVQNSLFEQEGDTEDETDL